MEILARLGHVARYLVGAAAAGAVFLAESAILIIPYAVLAMIGHGLLGAVLGLLLGFLIAFAVGLLMVTVIIFPAVLLAELLARRTHWAVAPLAILPLLLTNTAVATVIWHDLGAWDEVSFVLTFASIVLPAIAFALITYPAEWLTVRLLAFLKRHGSRLISHLKAVPADAQLPADR
jgi:hypothetical protein